MALFGIYGRHEINMCPWNNVETAKRAIEIENSDLSTNPETKTTQLDFLVPDDVSGPITIRFENLGGGIFSNLDFPAIVKGSSSHESISMIDSPRKQMANGIKIENVECNSGLILIKKFSGSAACVTMSTADKLVERGWGYT